MAVTRAGLSAVMVGRATELAAVRRLLDDLAEPISTKTASVHVSNILAKLGMSSRAEIAAWVARSG